MERADAVLVIVGIVAALSMGGCAAVAGGAAGGAAGYEYSNKRAADELEADYKAGRIGKDEYLQRKEEISKRSLVQ